MEGRKRKNRSGEEPSISKRSRSDTSPGTSMTENVQDPLPSTSGINRPRIQKYVRGKERETPVFEDNGTDNSSTDSRAEIEAAGRGTHADPGDMYQRSYDEKYQVWPGTTDEGHSPQRDWTSSSYTGSVRGLKRVKRKLFKGTPSPKIKGRTRNFESDTRPSAPENSSSEKSSKEHEPSSINRGTRPEVKPLKRKKAGTNICPGSSKRSNENVSGPATGLRRSNRYRVPPLEAWRNERLIFKNNERGELECMGIERGTAADNSSITQILRKQDNIKNYKKKEIERNRSMRSILTKVRNTRTGRYVQARVHRPYKSLEWSNSTDPVQPINYTTTNAFSSSDICFGFLEVAPFCTTGRIFYDEENIFVCVIKGHLEVTVEQRKFLLKSGDSFLVPFGVPYEISNRSNTKGQVSFCHFEMPFFPHQQRT